MEDTNEHSLPLKSDLYQTLECGADGKPGGILITSVSQQVIPHVWLGGYKALETVEFLEKNKITCILTLGHFKPYYSPGRFLHKIIPITDNPEANIIHYFPESTAFIDHAIKENHNILVHCLAGVSRSPTILTAYLMATQKLRWKEALAIIKQTRPFVNPNPGFIEQLKLFQEMNYTFDPNHPAYLEYLHKHPVDAGHVGHEDEYE
ncbi:dual specificity protein phosphatase 19 [Mucor ambiguus]|uniref:protein-tyrosine-phosphatase n=1 Tax=Mucor ambiguus TaxID=91626 RepID=A0A0C9LV22_9FUNG|nr:dual specificity protein phosphatase 19 [Mucor ambiguus]